MTQRLPRLAAAKCELLVALRPQHARVVLTERPTHGIGHVGFSGSVRTNDRGNSGCEFEMSLVYERFEPCQCERLQDRVRCRRSALDDLQLIAHCVTNSMSFAAAASSAARFDGPVPWATFPATSTSTTKPRLCS